MCRWTLILRGRSDGRRGFFGCNSSPTSDPDGGADVRRGSGGVAGTVGHHRRGRGGEDL